MDPGPPKSRLPGSPGRAFSAVPSGRHDDGWPARPCPPRLPRPIESFQIPLPSLPPELDGLTILHISDLHVRAHILGRRSFTELLDALAAAPSDLVVLTGDYMDLPGHEAVALAALHEVIAAARPLAPGGLLGIFGNHDTLEFQRAARSAEAERVGAGGGRGQEVRWLEAGVADVEIPGRRSLRVLGLSWPEDLLAAALALDRPDDHLRGAAPFILTLAHMPNVIFPAADLGLPLVLAGHTHAGQVRLSPRSAPHTSSDTPSHLASGTLRVRDTLLCISRGLGEAVFEGARLNCPRQLPRYTLRRAPLPSTDDASRVAQVIPW